MIDQEKRNGLIHYRLDQAKDTIEEARIMIENNFSQKLIQVLKQTVSGFTLSAPRLLPNSSDT